MNNTFISDFGMRIPELVLQNLIPFLFYSAIRILHSAIVGNLGL